MALQFNQAQDGVDLKITEIRITEPPGSKKPEFVIKKGQLFNIEVDLEYKELLGDVHAEVSLKICVNEICGGASQAAYEQKECFNLPKDTTQFTHKFENLTANVTGIFKLHSGALVKESEIAAYMEGPVLFIIEA